MAIGRGAQVTVYTGGKDGTTATLPVIFEPKTYPEFYGPGGPNPHF